MSYPYTVVAAGSVNYINMTSSPEILDNGDGSVTVTIDTSGMASGVYGPTGFLVIYAKMTNGVAGEEVIYPSTNRIMTISGLTQGAQYRFRVCATNSSGSGCTVQVIKDLSSSSSQTASATSVPTTNGTANKSLLTLTNTKDNFNAKKWSTVYKQFDSIDAAGSGDIDTYYSFGTAMYMDSNFDNPNQSGSIGFFLGSQAQNGYYLSLQTTSLAASANKKELSILKSRAGSLTKIADSQTTIAESLNGVYGGREYIVNIKVHFSRRSGVKTVKIYASVNGYEVNATDVDETVDGVKNICLEPSKIIGLACQSGKTSFDYVFAKSITKEQFDKDKLAGSVISGVFSNDFLKQAFGEIVYDANITDSEASLIKPGSLDEFGTTVREIYHANVKFETRPVFPIKISTGLNTAGTLLGGRMGNFDVDLYLLNNSSSMLPIDGSNLYIYGSTLSDSGQLEYVTDSTSEYVSKQPVIFETKWLQSLQDVKSLASWIQKQVINKGKLVSLSVFGNPLLSVGDIVTIKHTYADLVGDETKELFIITNVSHEYTDGGLNTELVCRQILSVGN